MCSSDLYTTLLTADSNGEQEMPMSAPVTMSKWVSEYGGGEEGPDKVKLTGLADKFTQMQLGPFANKDDEAKSLGADTGKLRQPKP